MISSAQRRVQRVTVLVTVLALGAVLMLAGCERRAPIGSGGGGGAPAGRAGVAVDPSAIEGKWLYFHVEDQKIVHGSGFCITIEDNRVSQFVPIRVTESAARCDGENLLVSGEAITSQEAALVLRFTIRQASEGDAERPQLDVTATVAANGELFVGEEKTAAPDGRTLTSEIVLRTPEGLIKG